MPSPCRGLLCAAALLLHASVAAAQETQEASPPQEAGALGTEAAQPSGEVPAAPPATDGAGMGLDLSGEMGLDLTSDTREKRPTVAVFGVLPLADATPEESKRAAKLHGLWLAELGKRAAFSRLVPPDEVVSTLAENADTARACATADCFAPYAATLVVDRVLAARLVREAEGLTLVAHTYDRGLHQLVTETVLLKGSSREVERAGLGALAKVSDKAAEQMVALVVKVNVPEATVTLGEEDLGQGNIDRNVSASERKLRVVALDHDPFEEVLTLTSGETRELTVELVVRPPPPVEQVADADLQATELESRGLQMPSLFKKPGLYVAAAGGVALVVGAVMGAQAKSFQSKADDGNGGVLGVTRQEYLDAQSKAKLANLLMGGGVAAVAGGVTWMVLTPTAPRAGSGGGVGVSVSAGGSF